MPGYCLVKIWEPGECFELGNDLVRLMLLEGHFGNRVEDGLWRTGPVDGHRDRERQAALRHNWIGE